MIAKYSSLICLIPANISNFVFQLLELNRLISFASNFSLAVSGRKSNTSESGISPFVLKLNLTSKFFGAPDYWDKSRSAGFRGN